MGTPPPIQIAILGWEDSLLLMVIGLVVVGPRKLPQLGRQIGKLMYEFRKASNDFKFQMEEELRLAEDADRRKKEEARQQALALAAPAEPAPAPDPETVAETPFPEAQSEETSPRIQPPSTGEQVEAAKPTGQAEQAAAQIPTPVDAADSAILLEAINPEASVEANAESESPAVAVVCETVPVSSPVSEQAGRHG